MQLLPNKLHNHHLRQAGTLRVTLMHEMTEGEIPKNWCENSLLRTLQESEDEKRLDPTLLRQNSRQKEQRRWYIRYQRRRSKNHQPTKDLFGRYKKSVPQRASRLLQENQSRKSDSIYRLLKDPLEANQETEGTMSNMPRTHRTNTTNRS